MLAHWVAFALVYVNDWLSRKACDIAEVVYIKENAQIFICAIRSNIMLLHIAGILFYECLCLLWH